jgi:hypothetical protein
MEVSVDLASLVFKRFDRQLAGSKPQPTGDFQFGYEALCDRGRQ